MDYDNDYANTEDYGYNHSYGWDANNYGVDHSGGINYGNYHGDYTRDHGFGQAGYDPFYYMRGPVPPLPPVAPEPPEPWEHEFGPDEEEEEESFDQTRYENRSNFLLRCGVPRHLVEGLPEAFLDLIGYDNCGICRVEFSSIKMGRVHYVSKNHLRHQKKWLEKKVKLGPRNSKEKFIYTRDHGFGQAGYDPFYYMRGPVPPLPPVAPEPPEPWEHEFGPDEEEEEESFDQTRYENRSNFLLRCGVPRHLVEGLPEAFLDLIGYDNCGICRVEFSSIKMGRVHYVSKNHLRHQKKWLEKKVKLGPRNSKEIPLKSRELYCELCDVHLTSKTHADSHYAGKVHHATVLGRKKPKNPLLLHPSMKDRLDRLTRREKKNLNIIEVTVEKGYQIYKPEMRCEICKTSVTSPEQMTMHLNGRKHLSKEKNHILSMMKAGQPVQKETESKEKNEDNDGWGSGGGNWDDDPQ